MGESIGYFIEHALAVIENLFPIVIWLIVFYGIASSIFKRSESNNKTNETNGSKSKISPKKNELDKKECLSNSPMPRRLTPAEKEQANVYSASNKGVKLENMQFKKEQHKDDGKSASSLPNEKSSWRQSINNFFKELEAELTEEEQEDQPSTAGQTASATSSPNNKKQTPSGQFSKQVQHSQERAPQELKGRILSKNNQSQPTRQTSTSPLKKEALQVVEVVEKTPSGPYSHYLKQEGLKQAVLAKEILDRPKAYDFMKKRKTTRH